MSYERKSVVEPAARIGLYGGGVGLFVSTIQNALSSHSRGAMGVITRTGGTIGLFGEHSSLSVSPIYSVPQHSWEQPTLLHTRGFPTPGRPMMLSAMLLEVAQLASYLGPEVTHRPFHQYLTNNISQ